MKSSLLIHHYIASEIHPYLNEGLNMDDITIGSSRKIWWMGRCGHEWEASVDNRANANTGCPYCTGRKVLKGFNDLESQSPELMKEWNWGKNSILPSKTSCKSTKKVWWIDKLGHEWESHINTRFIRKAGCPYCSGRQVLIGFNDLTTTNPELIKEWHNEKNGEMLPDCFSAGSNKKVWWIDDLGHEWEASIEKRALFNRKCPICSGNKISIGHNDLSTTHPNLAGQISLTLNKSLTGKNLTAGSNQKVWWECEKGHNWQVAVSSRIFYATGCPICSNKQIIKGYNDLATLFPLISSEWHPNNNENLLPSQISSGSNKKVWWECEKKHSYQATPCSRTKNGRGCPFCSNLVSKSEQEIADYLKSFGLNIKQTDRTVLDGLELDIFLPEKNIAIEFNGLYWHSEACKPDINYHYNKWQECKKRGIQLIQIWEDEWNSNPRLVESMLSHKLKLGKNKKSIFARNALVKELTTKDAKSFLDKFHIQGFASASVYYGLVKDSDIKSLIALRKEADNSLNIIRYATSETVAGGFSKLLKHAEISLHPKSFITFSDNCVSDGSLYANNGFIVDKELPPDYKYVWRGERKHKFGYRLKRFKNDDNLLWQEGLTEKELAKINGLYRIWDAGKTRWIKKVKY